MQPVAVVEAQPEYLVPHSPRSCIRALTLMLRSLDLSARDTLRLVTDASEVRKKRHGLADPTLPHGPDKRDTISRRTTRETSPAAVLAPGESRRIGTAVQDARRP